MGTRATRRDVRESCLLRMRHISSDVLGGYPSDRFRNYIADTLGVPDYACAGPDDSGAYPSDRCCNHIVHIVTSAGYAFLRDGVRL